jgi:hypothetical protein
MLWKEPGRVTAALRIAVARQFPVQRAPIGSQVASVLMNAVARHSGSKDMKTRFEHLYQEQTGAIGYILLWVMGVPASLLFLIFLLRGCN